MFLRGEGGHELVLRVGEEELDLSRLVLKGSGGGGGGEEGAKGGSHGKSERQALGGVREDGGGGVVQIV